jgi:phasin family protein
MDQKVTDNFAKLASNMMESMKDLQAINEKTMQDLTNQQFKSAQDFIKTSSGQMEQLGKAKTVEEAVSEQTKITSTMGQMMLDSAQATMQVLNKSQKELEVLISKTVKENTDN